MSKTLIAESELIQYLKNKDSFGYTYLYEHYSQALYAYISVKVKCHHTSQDLLQEVFIKVYEKFDQYDPVRGRLYTWMIHIAQNRVTDYFRSSLYKARITFHELSKGIAVSKSFDAVGVSRLVMKLEMKYQSVIRLSYYEGYTQVEIARQLGIPVGTVKTRLNAGLWRLKSC